MWATTADAITELRTFLSDGPTDKQAYRKKCFGVLNGTNLSFKTFDRRRTTDFSNVITVAPLGVYKNNVLLISGTDITSDSTDFGEFVLAVAPVDGDQIEASYYYQWFTDAELTEFLVSATQWLGVGIDPTKIDDTQLPAAKHFAAQEAYTKLASFWATQLSAQYLVEDAPAGDNVRSAIKSWLELSDYMRKKASDLRKDKYIRQDQALAPNFSIASGRVRDIVPRR